jgi:hypothetical protein
MPGKIPIKDAEKIAKARDCSMVIVFGMHENENRFTVTTYGKSKALCRLAADIGSKISEGILGGDITAEQKEPTHLPDEPTQWRGQKPTA